MKQANKVLENLRKDRQAIDYLSHRLIEQQAKASAWIEKLDKVNSQLSVTGSEFHNDSTGGTIRSVSDASLEERVRNFICP